MLKWGWDTKKNELVNLTRFGCAAMLSSLTATRWVGPLFYDGSDLKTYL